MSVKVKRPFVYVANQECQSFALLRNRTLDYKTSCLEDETSLE